MFSPKLKLSKFLNLNWTLGTIMPENRIIGLYKSYAWLNGVHFHVGSQGVPIELFVDAAKVIMLCTIYILIRL